MSKLNLDNIDLSSFQTNNQLNANMSEAVKVNPDQHSKTVNLSKESGVPEFAVESNPEEVEQHLKLDKIDFDKLSKDSPVSSKFLSGDVNNAIIAQEDVFDGLLEGVEKTFRGLGESIGIGFDIQVRGLGLAAIESTADKIENLIPPHAMPFPGMELDAQIASRQLAENAGIETDEQLQEVKKETTDRLIGEIQELQEKRQNITPDDMNIVQEGVRAGIESMVNMAPGLALTVLSRGRTAPLLTTMGVQTFSSSYGEGRAEGLSPEEARWYAGIDTVIEVGTELLPTGTLETILTGKSKGLKKDALKFIVRDMSTEQLATALQTANSVMFGLDKELGNAESAEEIINIQLRRQAVTAIATVVAGGTQITAATAINKTINKLTQTEQQLETKGQIEQTNIDKLNSDAVKSKLRERDAESFKQFIRDADGDNNTHVYIDPVQTSLYLQGKTREEIETSPDLKALNDAMKDSRVSGVDASVPVDIFMNDVAGTQSFTELRDHMTMSTETQSPFRQEQHRVETENYVTRLMEEANENASEYVESQEIYTKVRDQLIDTGTVNPANASVMAQIVPAWATAQARRTGKSVQEVYDLNIEGPLTGERERLEGELTLAQSAIDSMTNQQIVSELRGLKDTQQELVHFDIINEETGENPVLSFEALMKTIYATDSGNVYSVSSSGKIKQFEEEKANDFLKNKIKNAKIEIKPADKRGTDKLEESRRRQKRLDEAPKATGDFNNDLKMFADYAENFQEFNDLLTADMMDVSDRNRTRISRAAIALDNETENASNINENHGMIQDVINKGIQEEVEVARKLVDDSDSITIYRAMPERGEIEAGDWVGVIEDYAKSHESNTVGEKAVTKSKKVNKKDLYTFGVFNEWVYIPEGTWGKYKSLKDVWADLAPGKPITGEVLRQADKDGARGYYDPSRSVIRLNESSDLSTFSHEFAHFMYEMELQAGTELGANINNWYKRNGKDVAKEAANYLNDQYDPMKQGDFSTSEKNVEEADVTTYIDTGTTGNKDKDIAIHRATHEQFARGFETYLMEGKAPSIELRNAFRTFARWLAQIYQAFRGDLNVKLDAEMRQVFDRLLATEEQLAAAESRARIEPMFTDAAMAGMTEEEFADYKKRQEKVKDIQSETLREKMIKAITRKTKKWWKEEKADIVDEELDKLSGERVYTTTARLKDGDMKLDHATVKEMVGEERTDRLQRKSIRIPDRLRGMTAKGMKGVHPDQAAAFFGYRSGSEMLNDIINTPDIKAKAESNAEAIMTERHGDVFSDGTIEQQADEAIQNEERGKLILHELKTLARGTNQRVIERQVIQSIAQDKIDQLSFREIHPGKYRKAEINAAQEAARMLAEGNREGAAQAKTRQALNYYLGMKATEAKNNIAKIVDRMSRYNKKKVREEIQKAEGGYWEQISKILDRFEFRKSATLKQVEEAVQDVNTWMRERIDQDGDALVLHNAVLNEAHQTHWKNVPHGDLQGINDSVKNIEHVARYANKLTRMGEEIEFKKLVDRWVTSMDKNVKTKFKSKRTDVAEGRKWGNWLMAQMTKIPFMASWLDGGERTGISHQVLVQPFTDAYAAELELWGEAGKPVMDAIQNRSKETKRRHNTKFYIPEIDDHLYGHQILAVALNTGNESNLKKLLLGEKWAEPDGADINFDNAKLQAVLGHMHKSDWDMVQMIWDQMDTLYPKLAEVHRRTTGLTPPKIEATPVETEFGTFKGGYYPIKYDPNRSHKAALNEDKLNAETESMFSAASIQSSVNTGATNERTGFYDAIRLSLDVVPAHFQETIHYITHHDPVREVNRLIRNQRVATTIKEKMGPEEYAQLKPWLNDIAKDGRESPTKTFIDDMFQRLRFGVTLGVMGFKASTGIIQISGLSNTVAEVGLKNVMQSTRSILGSTTKMKQAWEFAAENSKVMKHRTETMDREIKNAMKRIEGKRGLLAAVQEASMKHIALIQTYMVDLPSWHASYIKGMKEWGDEQRAFQYADWVVENVQGSGATKDLARIMRSQSETHRMFTMFMTFFSSLWNMERDLVKGAKSGAYSTTSIAAKMMFLFVVPVLFEMLMRGEFGGEQDDDESSLQKMLTGVAMYPIQSVPVIRDIANGTFGDFGYNMTPLQSILEAGTQHIPQLVKKGFTDEEITAANVKGATKFIGAVAGIPGISQAWATGEHLHDVLEEGEEFTVHQLLFGPAK